MGNLVAALKNDSEAIALDSEDALVYSNRSAVFCGLNRFDQALDDAEVAIKLKPNWAKVKLLSFFIHVHFYWKNYNAVVGTLKGMETFPHRHMLEKGPL